MPEKKYFGRLLSAFFLGIIALVIAGIIFFLLLPFFIPLTVLLGLGLMTIVIFIVLWIVIYVAMVIGAALFYLTKPMKISKTGSYKVSRTKEAGKRQKGRTK